MFSIPFERIWFVGMVGHIFAVTGVTYLHQMNPSIDLSLLNRQEPHSEKSTYLEQLIEGQGRILEMISRGGDLRQILEAIVLWAEKESRDGLIASILLTNYNGQCLLHGAAPSLPENYCNAIHGIEIGPEVGSCGTAAYRKEQVIVEDIQEDPLWKNFRGIAALYELRACWSNPLISKDGQVLGTFAMYYRHPKKPTVHDLQIINLISYTTVIAIEWTKAAEERKLLLENEKRNSDHMREERQSFYNMLMNAPAMIAVLKGPDHVFELANPIYLQAIGHTRQVIGKPVGEALPEVIEQGYVDLLDQVYKTGQSYCGNEVRIMLNSAGTGVLQETYFNFIYQPIVNDKGVTEGIFVHAVDVSELVKARKRAEESEHRFRSFVLNSPSPIAIYVGKEMRIQTANDAVLKAWEKDASVIGKTFLEALPELEGQPFADILDQVYTSGVSYHAIEEKVFLSRNGVIAPTFWNFSYTPLRDENGVIYGVMNTATEVTELVTAKRRLLAAEESLRSALEIGGLGTWSIDLQNNFVTCDATVAYWFGLPPDGCPLEIVIDRMAPEFREDVGNAMNEAIATLGVYEAEYRVTNPENGRERFLYAKGKVVADETGKPIQLNGINRDITLQRETEKELTRKVEMRTYELQQANVELNTLNENLKQFAYVASHDLQEPLRKINMFSDILLEKATENIPVDQNLYLSKISRAAKRMSSLIQDLLDFSRAESKDTSFVLTDLNLVVKSVIEDYELMIHQKQATVEVGDLPRLPAIPLQMNQLFYNLLGNALKFSKLNVPPKITIQGRTAPRTEVEKNPQLNPETPYAEIIVSDNGIGFDQQFAEQIFVIFQRLHGKFEYEGTGIGLALCKRIAENHNGAIYGKGDKGAGATFHILLPLHR